MVIAHEVPVPYNLLKTSRDGITNMRNSSIDHPYHQGIQEVLSSYDISPCKYIWDSTSGRCVRWRPQNSDVSGAEKIQRGPLYVPGRHPYPWQRCRNGHRNRRSQCERIHAKSHRWKTAFSALAPYAIDRDDVEPFAICKNRFLTDNKHQWHCDAKPENSAIQKISNLTFGGCCRFICISKYHLLAGTLAEFRATRSGR